MMRDSISRLRNDSETSELLINLRRDGETEGVIYQLDRGSIGPNPNEFVFGYSTIDHSTQKIIRNLVLRNIDTGNQVDTKYLFTVTVPAATPRTKSSTFFDEGYELGDLAFDNSFENISVVVATYSRLSSNTGEVGQKLLIRFAIFYARKNQPTVWHFFDSFSLPDLDDNCSFLMRSFAANFSTQEILIPFLSYPVVKQGVAVVSVANKLESTLSFFKVDFFKELLEFATAEAAVPYAASMRDSVPLARKTVNVMDVVVQNIVDRFPSFKVLTRKGNLEYERARKSLRISNRRVPV
jgi:hypothetical protein